MHQKRHVTAHMLQVLIPELQVELAWYSGVNARVTATPSEITPTADYADDKTMYEGLGVDADANYLPVLLDNRVHFELFDGKEDEATKIFLAKIFRKKFQSFTSNNTLRYLPPLALVMLTFASGLYIRSSAIRK